MAKELSFNLSGATYGATPIKLERKKIYGWTSLVATSRNGDVCNSAYLSPDDALIIPSGGLKQGTVNEDGYWIEKSDLTAYSEDGAQVLPSYPSSVYQLVNADLSAAVGDDIFRFSFSYRGGTNLNDAYLLNTPNGLFLFAGIHQDFPLVSLADETTIDDLDEGMEEEIDELDFSMF